MAGQDVTPKRPRVSRGTVVWLSIAVIVAVGALILLASVLNAPAASGPSEATASPSASTSESPEVATTSPGPTAPAPGAEPADPPTPGAEPAVPPTPGAAIPAPTAPAIPIDDQATAAPGVTVDITEIEAVQGEAVRAGDVAGPAVRFVLTVKNETDQPVSLATALVNVYYGADAVPASELPEPGGSPLPQVVAAGRSAAGTFIFTIPEDEREKVLITLDYQIGSPVVAFEGSVR